MYQQSDRLPLFPDTTTIQDDSLHIAGQSLIALAEHHGTPLYVYDRRTMDACAGQYRAALKASYPAPSSVTYAAKAFLCRGVAEWANQQGFGLDCSGNGEITTAVEARVASSNIIAHGVNKSEADLEAACAHAGTIVVDNLTELRRLAVLMRQSERTAGQAVTHVWLRLKPGETVQTHHTHTQTGQTGSKFGMAPRELLEAAAFARSAEVRVSGLHVHLGSNFRDTAPLLRAIDLAVQVARDIGLTEEWHFSPGGGWGVSYHEDELPQPRIDSYIRDIARQVVRKCRELKIALPTLHVEPGRSLIARAGVAVYRVGAVKRGKHHTWLLVDGGMADNPRYALYGCKYSCLPARGLGRALTETVSIAGPFCESGDILIEDLRMPQVEAGELLAIPVSGAYQLSMSSNYNGALRPAAVWLENGHSRLMLRRETINELAARQSSIL
jgi:diaminopimelate decarboxylase